MMCLFEGSIKKSIKVSVCVCVCLSLGKTSGDVNKVCSHTQGCRDILQMWRHYSRASCSSSLFCEPQKRKQTKTRASLYLEKQKQSSPPFFPVKHLFSSPLFCFCEWVALVVSVDVSVVALLSY
jgi:hypothetical protein